jgi:hypothetical protein
MSRAAASIIALLFFLQSVAPTQTASDQPSPLRRPDYFVLNREFPYVQPPLWFRVGDGTWKKGTESGHTLSIRHTSADHFILVARGDCGAPPSDSSKCSPVELLVQTGAAGQTQSWKRLLYWDSKQFRITPDLDSFFEREPSLRVVINGNMPVIGEVWPPSAGQTQQVVSKLLDDKANLQNHSWADKRLDPENDINVRIYTVPAGCRNFIPVDESPKQPIDQINIPAPRPLDQSDENGIALGGPKIFDSFVLKQKLGILGFFFPTTRKRDIPFGEENINLSVLLKHPLFNAPSHQHHCVRPGESPQFLRDQLSAVDQVNKRS